MSSSGIRFQNVRFAYSGDGWFLSVPELCLGQERLTCVVGPNGSGKSTLLRTAAGILTPGEGQVGLDGRPLSRIARRAIARQLGFLPQESPPLFDYTVEMVVRMGRYAHVGWIGALTDADHRAVAGALASVDMGALRDRPLSHLSGGERRRALIASVLAQEPGILLLDEPTASLDIHHAAAVMRLLAGFGTQGPRVVLVTHDINLAALFAERLILLIGGRIAADGPPAAVICPEVMRRAYGEDILVREHPETGGPMVVPKK